MIVSVTNEGVMQVAFDTGSPLPNETHILEAPAGGKWTFLADGATGLVTVTDGATGDPDFTVYLSPDGNQWVLVVTDSGTLLVSDNFTISKRILSPVGNEQIKTADGSIAVNYRIATFYAGTIANAPTFTSRTEFVLQPNPILLNSLGLPAQPIFIEIGEVYDFVLLDAANVEVYRWTEIEAGANLVPLTPSEWQQGEPAIFDTATVFTLQGDQRGIYTAGRRLRFAVAEGVIFGTVESVNFSGAFTEISMLMDDLPLTDPIGNMNFSLLSSTKCSVPDRRTAGLQTFFVGDALLNLAQPFNLLPPGLVGKFGTVIPPRWLLCNGASYLRADYPELFKAISTIYGAVDGTHFNVPDLRGRLGLGRDDMGGTPANRVTSASVGGANAKTLGGAGGFQTHALTLAEMGPHTHPYSQDGGAFLKEVSTPQVTVTTNLTGAITGPSGSNAPHSTTPPWLTLNKAVWAGGTYVLKPTAFSPGYSVAFY